MTRMAHTLREDQCTFVTISCSDLLRMRNVLYKIYRENQEAQIMLDNFFSQNYAVYKVLWKNMVKLEEPQMTI
jgi:hypothetical protein